MVKNLVLLGAAAAALLAAAASDPPKSAPAPKDMPSTCFMPREWSNWRPTPDARAIYVRVLGKGIYRMDFSAACLGLQMADAHLVTRFQSAWVCEPKDIQLEVKDSSGSFAAPCIVTKITLLSEAEAKALPQDQLPSP